MQTQMEVRPLGELCEVLRGVNRMVKDVTAIRNVV
jgi:hypothetical protein